MWLSNGPGMIEDCAIIVLEEGKKEEKIKGSGPKGVL
jgi:hypothetical protein